jgi:hypothetical protein
MGAQGAPATSPENALVNCYRRVGIEPFGRDVAEDRVNRAPHQGTVGRAVGFEGCDCALGHSVNRLAEFFDKLDRQTARFPRAHATLPNHCGH